MGDVTGISWTDSSWNPWRGCEKVSDGCAHCYAEQMSTRNPTVLGVWGPDGVRAEASESYWRLPLKWNRAAEQEGRRHRVFCLSLGDWLEDRPELIPLRGRLLTTVAATPWLDWQLLTKRPEGWKDRMQEVARLTHDGGDVLAFDWLYGKAPLNVWMGVSTENQEMADLRIPLLLQIPAVVRFISAEPLLSGIDLNHLQPSDPPTEIDALNGTHGVLRPHRGRGPRLSWVIVGGESGPNRRPCTVEWIADLVRQCREADIPMFVKQDSHARPGQQGRIPDALWIKGFPEGSPLPESDDPEVQERMDRVLLEYARERGREG